MSETKKSASATVGSVARMAEARQRARLAAQSARKPGGCKKCAERAAERARQRAMRVARR